MWLKQVIFSTVLGVARPRSRGQQTAFLFFGLWLGVFLFVFSPWVLIPTSSSHKNTSLWIQIQPNDLILTLPFWRCHVQIGSYFVLKGLGHQWGNLEPHIDLESVQIPFPCSHQNWVTLSIPLDIFWNPACDAMTILTTFSLRWLMVCVVSRACFRSQGWHYVLVTQQQNLWQHSTSFLVFPCQALAFTSTWSL